MKYNFTLLFCVFAISLYSQDASIQGKLMDSDNSPVSFANIALYNSTDSSLIKVEVTNDEGNFLMQNISSGSYYSIASFVGLGNLTKTGITITEGQNLDLGVLTFGSASFELAEAVVTTDRALVEIKADRTIFNVQGTINSTGSDAIELLRKAPAVSVDNNDNINVLGRSGVLLYVDGKRVPLSGDDLSNYLKNIPAEQIDKIDIITNPGAKYEAEGNAGIIDIRLKKDKSIGANGTLNGSYSQGKFGRGNIGGSANYRNRKLNSFLTGGLSTRKGFSTTTFDRFQNGIRLQDRSESQRESEGYDFRFGTDFFLNKKHTIGFLVSGRKFDNSNPLNNRVEVSNQNTLEIIDSILIADNNNISEQNNSSYNINYRFENKKGRSLNIDLDYGQFKNKSNRHQPNRYYDATGEILLTENINNFDTPRDIGIYTFKLDFEESIFGGTLGLGSKLSKVISNNTFLVYDVLNEIDIQDDRRSNTFDYDENVYAAYINFAKSINKKWSYSAGLRAEQTDAVGDLKAFLPELQEEPVELNYLSWFPSAGLTYQLAPQHNFALNYGRRINRPNYNVLNPFSNQVSELSYRQGNPRLSPEIVNNIELGYTLKYRYNFKIAYSETSDKITRLIGPDETDPRANFITWSNLSRQSVLSFNISAPVQFTKKWNAFFNISASQIDNQADYGDGAIVDVQVFSYRVFQQHTINLPFQFKGEISGYYSGPGVWGGVFEYDANWSLNLGLQRKFFGEQLNVRVSGNDIFQQSGWQGTSTFNGLVSNGKGRWDSRRVSLSLSYNFGNQQLKKSRKRKTGLEAESGRVGN